MHYCDEKLIEEQKLCGVPAEFGLARRDHESFSFVVPMPWRTVCRSHLDPFLDDPKVVIFRLEARSD
jgi:hypothetical protein